MVGLPKMTVVVRLLAILSLAMLAGCGGLGKGEQESLLLAAGFRPRTPETPRQKELYASARSYTLLHGTINGQSFYAYKHKAKGIAYVGGPTDYGRYRELEAQVRLGRKDYVEEEMKPKTAINWHDEWQDRQGLAGGPLDLGE